MTRAVTIVFPARYFAVGYVVIIAAGLLLPLIVGRREHMEELVQTHCHQPGEWLPSISATTGDKTPERFIWRYALVMGAGFRLATSFAVFQHFTTLLGTASTTASWSNSANLVKLMYASDWARILAAGGWTVISSSESWMTHTLSFASYIFFGFVLQVTQYVLALRTKQHITHGEKNARLKLYLLLGQTFSAFMNATLYMHHQSTCALYSNATLFEWCFAACNVAFDLTQYYDLEHETVSLTTGQQSGSSTSTGALVTVRFAEMPSEMLLWVADLFFGYFFWAAIAHLMQAVYFLPMVAMETTIECATILFVGSPMVLRIQPIRESLRRINFFRGLPGYWWMYTLSLVSLFSVDVTRDPYLKILSTSIGTLFLSLGFFLRYTYSTVASGSAEVVGDARDSDGLRLLYSLPLGFTLNMTLRYMYVSLDPMFSDSFFNAIFGLAFGLVNLTTLYRKCVYGDQQHQQTLIDEAAQQRASSQGKGDDAIEVSSGTGASSQQPSSSASTASADGSFLPESVQGVCFGLAVMLGFALVTGYGVLPRLIGLDPAAGSGLAVIVAFTIGVAYSQNLTPAANSLPQSTLRRPSPVTVLFGFAQLRTFLLVAGFLTMTYTTLQSNRVLEQPHEHYPTQWNSKREHVDIKDWKAEEMWGSPKLALCGGLMLIFALGASFPPVMHFTIANLRQKRLQGGGKQNRTSFFASFEFCYFVTFFLLVFAHVFVVDHPFIPGAWILRDSLDIVLGTNVVLLALSLNYLSIKAGATGFSTTTLSSAPSNTDSPQRSSSPSTSSSGTSSRFPQLPKATLGMVLLLLFAAVVIRAGHQPGSVSVPAGKTTLLEHRDVVLSIASKLLQFEKQLNSIDDPNIQELKRSSMEAATRHELQLFEEATVKEHGEDIWFAAKNIAPVSGMIWTVHFGLDNFNNDNILRLAEMAKETKAGIIGLLESDSQRIINGNRDMVELMSYQLGYDYSDWGPTTFDGTFGCAIISKYPIRSVKRYVLPSPLGELACLIHANVDIFGTLIHVYVGHWGNTQHWADGILQSQFLGQVVQNNPGPSIFLGYLVSKPGQEKYNFYAKEGEPGMLVDPAKELYERRPWEKVHDHAKNPSGAEFSDPPYSDSDDKQLQDRDHNYKRPPSDAPVRYFYFPTSRRYSTAHPRWEYKDRYCQYIFYKPGYDNTERMFRSENAMQVRGSGGASSVHFELIDWWRVLDIHELSDTEIQVVNLAFGPGTTLTESLHPHADGVKADKHDEGVDAQGVVDERINGRGFSQRFRRTI